MEGDAIAVLYGTCTNTSFTCIHVHVHVVDFFIHPPRKYPLPRQRCMINMSIHVQSKRLFYL